MIGLEVVGLEDAGIGADLVPFLEDDDIAGDDVGGEDLLFLAVPDDPGIGGKHLLQGAGGLLRLELLEEGEEAVDQIDAADGDAQLRRTGEEGHNAAGPQQQCHQAGEVGQQLFEQAVLFFLLQLVFAVLRQAALGLFFAQAAHRRIHQAAGLERINI